MHEFVITANSPGEVAAWVKPVVKKLKENYPQSLITVFLTPCVFASGSEKKVLSDYPEIDRIFDKYQYLKFMFLGQKPPVLNRSKSGLIIFLGGDLLHAVLLGKKFNYPVIAYTEGVFGWQNSIDRFMVPDERTRHGLFKKGAAADKIEVIGNLMFDSVTPVMTKAETRDYLGLNQELNQELVVNLFPGSRPAEVEYMLPFFLQAIISLKNTDLAPENFRFLLSCSPFVSKELLQVIFKKYLKENNINGNIKKSNDTLLMQLAEDIELEVYDSYQYSLMQITDLALTIPGTNNLELAYLGIPMIVVLPLNKPEDIPLEGLAGLVGQVPVLGPVIKKIVVPRIEAKQEFISLPNIIAEEEIVPEVRGVLTPNNLVTKVSELLTDKSRLSMIKEKLKVTTGSAGAATNLVSITAQILDSSP